ncbi:hypothetical protein GCM10027514_24160 [Azotobacter armeniacus]
MLANYALCLLCLLGLQAREAREAGHERRFQSNSVKDKHVLSLWRLGLGLEYARTYAGGISGERLRDLELALRREVYRQAQELG